MHNVILKVVMRVEPVVVLEKTLTTDMVHLFSRCSSARTARFFFLRSGSGARPHPLPPTFPPPAGDASADYIIETDSRRNPSV